MEMFHLSNSASKLFMCWVSGMLLIITGCVDFTDNEIYQPPANLEGKLFDRLILEDNSDLSIFAECLERTGLSENINKTGYYTVFAPTNEAFEIYFNDHPEYGGAVQNIPYHELDKLVRFHIIQNGWTRNQLISLDYKGWIDEDDVFYNKPRGFKRETILKDTLHKFWVRRDKFDLRIVNESESNEYRVVFPDARKYVPLYYQGYFSFFNYTSEDYEFYFNRPFEGGQTIYYANGKVLTDEIAAENGFIYKIDRVVEPMPNIQQALEQIEKYSNFLELIYQYPEFRLDLGETFNQAGAREGKNVDSLFSLEFSDLEFSINNEKTGRISGSVNYTLREHNSILDPTNEALEELYHDVILSSSGYPHYSVKSAVPEQITKIIINSHMTRNLLYKKDLTEGFRTGERDLVTIDPASIVNRKYCSNGVIIGVNKAIVPYAFQSVAAPVYLRPGYQTFFNAIDYTNILPALTKSDVRYSFYIIDDNQLERDSSLLLIWGDRDANRFHFDAFDRSVERFIRIRQNDLTKWIMNQIVIGEPEGFARREFLENLGGNYIIIDNEDNTVQGAIPSKFGYEGDSTVKLYPELLDEPSQNGNAYNVSSWFLNSVSSIYGSLARHTKFINLLDKAKLAEKITFRMLFLSETEYYTVFVPSNEALESYGADTLSLEELQKLLKLHFVKGHLLFTDGKKPSGTYETMQVDEERSTGFNTYFTTLNINTGYDEIQILDSNGDVAVQIDENPDKTNFMAGRDIDKGSTSRYDFVTNCIIHVIDQVIEK